MKIALALLATSLTACNVATTQPEAPRPKAYIFAMPIVHDTVAEFLICSDTLHNGTKCDFVTRGNVQATGIYESQGDWSFLDTKDSSIQWPNHDNIGPILTGVKY